MSGARRAKRLRAAGALVLLDLDLDGPPGFHGSPVYLSARTRSRRQPALRSDLDRDQEALAHHRRALAMRNSGGSVRITFEAAGTLTKVALEEFEAGRHEQASALYRQASHEAAGARVPVGQLQQCGSGRRGGAVAGQSQGRPRPCPRPGQGGAAGAGRGGPDPGRRRDAALAGFPWRAGSRHPTRATGRRDRPVLAFGPMALRHVPVSPCSCLLASCQRARDRYQEGIELRRRCRRQRRARRSRCS